MTGLMRVFAVVLLGAVPAGSSALRAESLETALLADTADGRLDDHTLLRGALIAGGVVDTDKLSEMEACFAHWSARLPSDISLPADSRTMELLHWMHREILTGGYRNDSFRLDHPLHDGTYNCVSSAVLFHLLACDAGLSTQLVLRPSHLVVQLEWNGGHSIIETTNPGAECGGPVPGEPDGRLLSPVETIALFYYNRAAQHLTRREHSRAVTTGAIAYRLDPRHQAGKNNLLASLNNWAVALTQHRRYTEAIVLLSAGQQLAPDAQFLKHNCRYAIQRHALTGARDVTSKSP